MSEEMTLHQRMSGVMADVGYLQKEGTFKIGGRDIKYATAEQVLNKVREAFAKHGISICGSKVDTLSVANEARNVIVRIQLDLTDGKQVISFQGVGQGSDSGDKATMKANTAAIKYLVTNMALISWGDDPEAGTPAEESTSSGESPKRRGRKPGSKNKPKETEGEDKPKKESKADKQGSAKQELLGKIEKAETVEALTELKPAIREFVRETGDNSLITAHRAREKALTKDSEDGEE